MNIGQQDQAEHNMTPPQNTQQNQMELIQALSPLLKQKLGEEGTIKELHTAEIDALIIQNLDWKLQTGISSGAINNIEQAESIITQVLALFNEAKNNPNPEKIIKDDGFLKRIKEIKPQIEGNQHHNMMITGDLAQNPNPIIIKPAEHCGHCASTQHAANQILH